MSTLLFQTIQKHLVLIQVHVKKHGKNTNAHVCHIVPMTESLDCRLNSSLRLQHLCSWEMLVSIQMLPCCLGHFLGSFSFQRSSATSKSLVFKIHHSANFQKHLIMFTFFSQLNSKAP